MDAKELTDDALMSAIKSVCDFDAERAEKWRPEALAIGRAVERAVRATTPQPTTQFEAWAKLHHYDLTRCSHEPYAAYRSDLTNAALAGWRGKGARHALEPFEYAATNADERPLNGIRATFQHDEGAFARCSYCGRYSLDPKTLSDRQPTCDCGERHGWSGSFEKPGLAAKWSGDAPRATAPQPTHYQQLLGVAYVVLGCLVANGVDIPVRFLDAFADPDSVENPLELLPCDFSPAQAVRAVVEAVTLTDEQILTLYRTHRITHRYLNDAVISFARAIEQASRTAALEEAANACDELRQLALEDMALENDERFGVYAKKYRNAALRIRALAKGDGE